MLAELVAELKQFAQDTREDKMGAIIAQIYRYLGTLEEDDEEYRCSKLYEVCPFKKVLDALFPESAERFKPLKVHIQAGMGTGIHYWFQNHLLGPAGIIEGDWRCKLCGDKRTGKMPVRNMPGELEGQRTLTEIEPTFKASEKRMLDPAQCSHSWEYQEIEVVWEGKETGGRRILGHVDGYYFVRAMKHVLDIKSVGHATFESYLEEPPEDNVYQMQLYLNLLDAEYGVFLYVCRSTGRMKTFTIKRDPTYLDDAARKIKLGDEWTDVLTNPKYGGEMSVALVKHLKKFDNWKHAFPDRECKTAQCKRAKFCPQKSVCFNSPVIEGRVKQLAEEVQAGRGSARRSESTT